MKINLLPAEYRPQAAVSLPRLTFTIAFIVCLFGMGIWLMGEWMALGQANAKLEEVNNDLQIYGQQYQKVKALENEKAEFEKKKKDINLIMQPFVPFEAVMNEISLSIPEKLWLNSVTIESSNLVTLMGKTDRMNAIALYMMDLEASPAFNDTRLASITNSNAGTEDTKKLGDVFQFNMTFVVDKAGLKK